MAKLILKPKMKVKVAIQKTKTSLKMLLLQLQKMSSRSQTQITSELATSIDSRVDFQMKQSKIISEEQQRHDSFLKFKIEESEKNIVHEC